MGEMQMRPSQGRCMHIAQCLLVLGEDERFSRIRLTTQVKSALGNCFIFDKSEILFTFFVFIALQMWSNAMSLTCHLVAMSGHVIMRSCLYQATLASKKVHTLAVKVKGVQLSSAAALQSL